MAADKAEAGTRKAADGGTDAGHGHGDHGEQIPQVHFILHHPAHGINRRQMVQRMLATTGAAMTLPALAAATTGAPSAPTHEYGTDLTTEMEARRTGPWTPLFLDPHQNLTYIALAEHLVPGATAAKVNQFVDLLLSVDSLERQRRFVEAVAAFDAMAGRFRRAYKDCTPRQQIEMLTWASQQPSGDGETHAPGWAARMRKDEEAAPRKVTLRDYFDTLKSWTSEAYYSSEPGKKSLGWTGRVFWSTYPGCPHPPHHAQA